MTPRELLRHRPPALLLATIDARHETALRCASVPDGPWPWPRMLEGAAQTAGLLAGFQPGGPENTAVIAEYRDVRLHVAEHPGPLTFHATLDRRLVQFWRCRCEVRALDGTLLLDASVTVSPDTGS
jgi:hypothetical protein